MTFDDLHAIVHARSLAAIAWRAYMRQPDGLTFRDPRGVALSGASGILDAARRRIMRRVSNPELRREAAQTIRAARRAARGTARILQIV